MALTCRDFPAVRFNQRKMQVVKVMDISATTNCYRRKSLFIEELAPRMLHVRNFDCCRRFWLSAELFFQEEHPWECAVFRSFVFIIFATVIYSVIPLQKKLAG